MASFLPARFHRKPSLKISDQSEGQRLTIEGPGRTALSDLRRHCPEQHRYIAISYRDLRGERAGGSRGRPLQQCLKPSGIELYDDRLELGSGDGKMRLVKAAREHADAPGLSHEILTATGGVDAEAELALGDQTDMCPMPSPANVLSAAGIVLFQQEAGPRG